MENNINRLLITIGITTFIKYFDEFKKQNKENVLDAFDNNKEPWVTSSKNTKAINGIRIFKEGLELSTLESIITRRQGKNIRNRKEITAKALELYDSYKSAKEISEAKEYQNDEEKKVLVKYRLQQSQYRKDLIVKWKGCSVTNCKETTLLIASHIKPYASCDASEKADVENGLLLTPNYDKLFDRFLISFDDNGKIMISDSLTDSDLASLNIKPTDCIDPKKITTKMKDYLAFHRSLFI